MLTMACAAASSKLKDMVNQLATWVAEHQQRAEAIKTELCGAAHSAKAVKLAICGGAGEMSMAASKPKVCAVSDGNTAGTVRVGKATTGGMAKAGGKEKAAQRRSHVIPGLCYMLDLWS